MRPLDDDFALRRRGRTRLKARIRVCEAALMMIAGELPPPGPTLKLLFVVWIFVAGKDSVEKVDGTRDSTAYYYS